MGLKREKKSKTTGKRMKNRKGARFLFLSSLLSLHLLVEGVEAVIYVVVDLDDDVWR